MTGAVLERRRSGWDVVLGILLIIAGVVILGHVVVATVISVVFLGWMALVGGVVALIAALFRIGRGGFWATALSGGLLLVLGLMLRNPGAAALTFTLVAGSLFPAGGLVRLIAAFEPGAPHAALLLRGVVGVVLGLIVLSNLFKATLTLLGVLVGCSRRSTEIMLLLFGRLRVNQRPDLDRTGGAVRRG
jgi:uncharacterized membrane protein HdeD (DUF308 family)